MKRIAIVGAGLAGLAACYCLSELDCYEITLIDGVGVGGGASAVSPGLLHPYVGAFPDRTYLEAFKKACAMVEGTAIRSRGILRLAQNERQESHFRRCAQEWPDVEWVAPQGHCSDGGLWIKEGLTIDVPGYLESLWKRCSARGVRLVQERVEELSALEGYDRVLLAMGSGIAPHLRVNKVKGQTLTLRWPEGVAPLPYSIIGKRYIVPEGDERCTVGATYEHNFADERCDVEAAKADLLPHIWRTYPPLREAAVIDCRAGVRASLPRRAPPALRQLSERCWAIAGLGSKGLLYHAYLAEKIVESWAPRR